MTEHYNTLGKAGSDSILFAHKASLLLDDEMYEDAMNLCEMGVKKFPYYAEGHFVLGKCYQFLERYDDARNEYERTLFFAPGHVKAMGALAYVYYKKKLKKLGNTYLLKTAVYEPNNRELIEYLIAQKLYLQLFKSPIVDEQLSADLDGFLPSEAEQKVPEDQVRKSPGVSEETKQILTKDQPDLAEESYRDQDKYEVQNIIDRIEENEMQKRSLDLSQYANVEDDFATLMGDFSANPEDGESADSELSEAGEQMILTPEYKDLEESIPMNEPRPGGSPGMEEISELEEAAMTFKPDVTGDAEPAGSTALREEEEPLAASEPQRINDVINNSSEQEEQAFSDLLLEPEGSESEEVPTFEREDLAGVSARESDLLDEFDDEIRGTEPEAGIEPEDLSDRTPESAETGHEEKLIFTKKHIESDSIIPEPVADEEGVVTIKEIMSNPSLVTPTFGEILISQRKFSEARHVFLKLWERNPDNPRFKEKVEFLDKLIKLQS